jgi:cephalosporin-C deacetylase-like acetyl esterase
MDWRWKTAGTKAKYDALNAQLSERFGVSTYSVAGMAEGREAYFYHPVILGIDRAVDWIVSRPDVDRSRVWYHGTSQGGGFGFYLCSLNKAFTKAAFFVPALTDTMGYLAGRQSGWPSVVEKNSANAAKRAAAEKWAPYFDGANFASRITCRLRVIVGFSDVTCPPCAVYAAYNEIPSRDKDIFHGIGMGHSVRRELYARGNDWLFAAD